ncbi:MAG: 4-hydroxy-tetrahydrodipicolinate reductase [Alphaproteobacteria bacterium]|nr:4-hydroxy-tetrahydrodipicolinate reductase [Alphaproteobacteria bacterium]
MKIGVAGHQGRIGQLLVKEIEQASDLEFTGGFGKGDNPTPIFKNADIVIDFTTPEATIKNLTHATENKTSLVIGTTGLTQEQEEKIKGTAQSVPVLYAANMSLGVNLLLSLVEQAASRLGPEWDIEIFETHHRHKIDSPSGTALSLGHAAKQGRGGKGDFITERAGKRSKGDIGFAVQRGGEVIGEHDVTFFGGCEQLTLSHKATDRALFVKGALHAARWLAGKPAGLYSMKDVLNL